MYCILYLRTMIHFLKNGNVLIVSLISFLLLLLIPRQIPIPHFMYFQSMYPFFLIGFLSNRYDLLHKINIPQIRRLIIAISALTFSALYFIYKKEDFFYFFIRISTKQWIISYGMMLLAGFSGIVLSYYASSWLSHKDNRIIHWLSEVGRYTLAIYMMQGVLCLLADKSAIVIRNQYVLFGCAIAVFIFLILLINLIRKNKTGSLLFLGKK